MRIMERNKQSFWYLLYDRKAPVTDEDGNELVLEYVDTLEHNGLTYTAFFPAVEEDADEDDADYGLVILKTIVENGEELLSTLDSEEELNEIYQLFSDQLFADDDDEE
mgnify:CR=1 FL=1